MIPTHALSPLSYRIPKNLEVGVKVGSVVSARLSGRTRVGVVVSTSASDDDSATETISAVSENIRLPEALVRVCERVASDSALSLASVLRTALPPGMKTDRYIITERIEDGVWEVGTQVDRRILRARLGDDGLKKAEADGSVVLIPALPEPRTSEWASVVDRPDLSRAHRQREMFEKVSDSDEVPVKELLGNEGMTRPTLRALEKRGAVKIETRHSREFLRFATGRESSPDTTESWHLGAGSWVSMAPTVETERALSDFARSITSNDGRLLVLVPEVASLERAVEYLASTLPEGTRIASLHSGIQERAEVWKSSAVGECDVLVGTRSAALFPLKGIGGICVMDEPNPAHRASPGHEGLRIHARDIVRHRSTFEGCPVLFLSPHPSIRLYSEVLSGTVREADRTWPDPWPKVRMVDMRGSGAALSSAALDACRNALEEGKTVGVVSSRLGYATSVSCQSCGAVISCPRCSLPLSVQSRVRLACTGCGFHRDNEARCPECGSSRLSHGGLAVESIRELLASRLNVPVGTLSAGKSHLSGASVVVGTPRSIASRRWDYTIVPDADAMFTAGYMSAVERAFRVVYDLAEVTGELLLVQTRNPADEALRSALKGDYRGFATGELRRLESLGYPPFVHLASLTFTGTRPAGAVKSLLQHYVAGHGEVSFTEPVRVEVPDAKSALRVLIRSPQLESVARVGLDVARRVANERSAGLRVEVEVDPEEV